MDGTRRRVASNFAPKSWQSERDLNQKAEGIRARETDEGQNTSLILFFSSSELKQMKLPDGSVDSGQRQIRK